jgi:hypothetical protein
MNELSIIIYPLIFNNNNNNNNKNNEKISSSQLRENEIQIKKSKL